MLSTQVLYMKRAKLGKSSLVEIKIRFFFVFTSV